MAHVAMPVANDFEDSEVTVPYEGLIQAGHEITVFGLDAPTRVHGKRGEASIDVTAKASELDPAHFDALVIPGGYSPDHLRTDREVVDFVRRFCDSGKLVAAVCHGPQLLIEADAVRGHTVTSWPSVRKDLENAGAEWVDREVVIDGPLLTSRNPGDLDAFCAAILNRLESAS